MLCGCAEMSDGSSSLSQDSVLTIETVGYFDFDEVCGEFDGEEVGIKRDGFVNTDDHLIHNDTEAFSRARNELYEGFSYNRVETDYDSNNDMWAVTFSEKDVPGGCITVYLDAYGRTQLIVSGE